MVLLTVLAVWVVCAWFVELLTVLAAWVVCVVTNADVLDSSVVAVVSVGLTVVLVPAGVLATVIFIVVCADGVVAFVVRKFVVVLTVVGGSKESTHYFVLSKSKTYFSWLKVFVILKIRFSTELSATI